MDTLVLLIQCPDHRGIVARVTRFVHGWGGNITDVNQHSTDPVNARFFMRLEFVIEEPLDHDRFESEFSVLAEELNAEWHLHYGSVVPRMAVAVSKFDHCLVDILYRVRSGELNVTIPMVISNHETTRKLVEAEGVPFHHLPVTKDTKADQEAQFLDLVRESSDFLVLARYMQILSGDFLEKYGKPVINIHHSFLPSFMGANPYRQAFERGVKLIGATAHYATTDLDEGPIIEQIVGRVSIKDDAASLQQKGKTIEQQALALAIAAHVEHRVLRWKNRTIVFE